MASIREIAISKLALGIKTKVSSLCSNSWHCNVHPVAKTHSAPGNPGQFGRDTGESHSVRFEEKFDRDCQDESDPLQGSD